MWLNLAINYGGRAEIVDAVRVIAESVEAGELSPGGHRRSNDLSNLYTAGAPDPDLLDSHRRRNADQQFSALANQLRGNLGDGKCWPEFDEATLHEAIRAYAASNRRFGGLRGEQDSG